VVLGCINLELCEEAGGLSNGDFKSLIDLRIYLFIYLFIFGGEMRSWLSWMTAEKLWCR
jgi:hypothetical protein